MRLNFNKNCDVKPFFPQTVRSHFEKTFFQLDFLVPSKKLMTSFWLTLTVSKKMVSKKMMSKITSKKLVDDQGMMTLTEKYLRFFNQHCWTGKINHQVNLYNLGQEVDPN